MGLIFAFVSFGGNSANFKVYVLSSGFFSILLCYLLATFPSNTFNVKYNDEGVWISPKMYNQLSSNTEITTNDKLKKKETELLKKVDNKQITMEDFEKEFFMLESQVVEDYFLNKNQNKEKKILIPWDKIENWKFAYSQITDAAFAVYMKSTMFNRRFFTNYSYIYFNKYLKNKQLNKNVFFEMLQCFLCILAVIMLGTILGIIISHIIFWVVNI